MVPTRERFLIPFFSNLVVYLQATTPYHGPEEHRSLISSVEVQIGSSEEIVVSRAEGTASVARNQGMIWLDGMGPDGMGSRLLDVLICRYYCSLSSGGITDEWLVVLIVLDL